MNGYRNTHCNGVAPLKTLSLTHSPPYLPYGGVHDLGGKIKLQLLALKTFYTYQSKPNELLYLLIFIAS